MNTGKQIYAMVVVLFLLLIAIGGYALFDPSRSEEAKENQIAKSAERGANTFALNCRLCHGDRGQGGPEGGRLPAAADLTNPRFRGIDDTGVFTPVAFKEAFELVTNTITCGRVGTPMPAWAESQGGTLSDEQVRQLAVLITEGDWEAAQEHADELDAVATGHAAIMMADGSFGPDETELFVDNAGAFTRGQYVRIAIDEETEERLRILPDQLLVERGAGGTDAADHDSGTELFLPGEEEPAARLSEDTEAEDAFLVVSGGQFAIGDTLLLEDEELAVTGFTSGLPTTGRTLVEDIGRTPDRFMISDSTGIELGLVIRLNSELLRVTTISDDGDPGIQLDAGVGAADDAVSFDTPLFFREDYVVRIESELMRVIEPVSLGQVLGETIGRAETSFEISGTDGIPFDRPIRIGDELLRVTEIITPAEVTVVRGVDDTNATSHSGGTAILRQVVIESDGAEDEETELDYQEINQTVSAAIGADQETFEVTGTAGIAIDDIYRFDDELVRVAAITPARVRVERGVDGTGRAAHARRAQIFDGNLFNVERAANGTQAASHEADAQVFMAALEVEREVEDSLLEAHTKNAEIFLGNQLIVERAQFDTEAVEHANGELVLDFPTAPAAPSINMASCGQSAEQFGPPDTELSPPREGSAEVAVALFEFEVEAAVASVLAGPVYFELTNEGSLPHNFWVIATDLAADELPLAGEQIDEGQLDVVIASDIVSAGNEAAVNPDLPAGSYVLICNVPGHYEQGMRVAFEVTAP